MAIDVSAIKDSITQLAGSLGFDLGSVLDNSQNSPVGRVAEAVKSPDGKVAMDNPESVSQYAMQVFGNKGSHYYMC